MNIPDSLNIRSFIMANLLTRNIIYSKCTARKKAKRQFDEDAQHLVNQFTGILHDKDRETRATEYGKWCMTADNYGFVYMSRALIRPSWPSLTLS